MSDDKPSDEDRAGWGAPTPGPGDAGQEFPPGWNEPPDPSWPQDAGGDEPPPWGQPGQQSQPSWGQPGQQQPPPWGQPDQQQPPPWGQPGQQQPPPWGQPGQQQPWGQQGQQTGPGGWQQQPGPGGWPQQGWYPQRQTESTAVVALVLSILSWVACPLLFAIAGVIVAGNAERKIRASNGMLDGEGLAKAARIVGIVNIVLVVLFIVGTILVAVATSV